MLKHLNSDWHTTQKSPQIFPADIFRSVHLRDSSNYKPNSRDRNTEHNILLALSVHFDILE